MLEAFIDAFRGVGIFLSSFAGGACAFLVFVAAVLLVLFLFSAVFDAVTRWIAKRMDKTGRAPKSRAAKVILRGYAKDGVL